MDQAPCSGTASSTQPAPESTYLQARLRLRARHGPHEGEPQRRHGWITSPASSYRRPSIRGGSPSTPTASRRGATKKFHVSIYSPAHSSLTGAWASALTGPAGRSDEACGATGLVPCGSEFDRLGTASPREDANAQRSDAGWVTSRDRLHGRVVARRWVVEMAPSVGRNPVVDGRARDPDPRR